MASQPRHDAEGAAKNMSGPSRAQVEQVLRDCRIPGVADEDPVSAGMVREVQVTPGALRLKLQLGYPAERLREPLRRELEPKLAALPGVGAVELDIGWQVQPGRSAKVGRLPGVRNLIAVASGKGGVGKSTTAVNLALALAREGARAGLLDADIYGPSQQLMLGIAEELRPEVKDGKSFLPVMAHGLQTMSMGYLVTEKTPMVWRGPMVSGALWQLLGSTLWDDLDYLVVDLPPGTGDIQLTLSQRAPLTGALIVTTPQDIALLDARKAIEMFRKVQVPVLGVVENMSIHICSQCGHREPIFGAGGGERIAAECGVPLLGALPLDIRIREQVDGGRPPLIADPEGEVAASYLDIARRLGAALARLHLKQRRRPDLIVKAK